MAIELGVPALSLKPESNAPVLDAPVKLWGSVARSASAATWCFYTDDYRFERLWRDPNKLVEQTSASAFEPNFSVFDDTPSAVAIWAIYRKRWLANYWQGLGLSIWVDLCVSRRHSRVSLLGVPRGWQRFCTAGFDARLGDLNYELRQARRHADGAPLTLAVYGGGKATQAWCAKHADVVHVPRWGSDRRRPGEGSRLALIRAAHG